MSVPVSDVSGIVGMVGTFVAMGATAGKALRYDSVRARIESRERAYEAARQLDKLREFSLARKKRGNADADLARELAKREAYASDRWRVRTLALTAGLVSPIGILGCLFVALVSVSAFQAWVAVSLAYLFTAILVMAWPVVGLTERRFRKTVRRGVERRMKQGFGGPANA